MSDPADQCNPVAWQPISTAPPNERVLVASAEEIAMGWKDLIDGRWYHVPQGGYLTFEPTHWQSIPPSPGVAHPPAEEVRAERTDEIHRLKAALYYWMPRIPDAPECLHDRIAQDAHLLNELDGVDINQPTAWAEAAAIRARGGDA